MRVIACFAIADDRCIVVSCCQKWMMFSEPLFLCAKISSIKFLRESRPEKPLATDFEVFGGMYMSQISVNHLTFHYEGSFDNIFEDVSFSIDTY